MVMKYTLRGSALLYNILYTIITKKDLVVHTALGGIKYTQRQKLSTTDFVAKFSEQGYVMKIILKKKDTCIIKG